MKNLRKYLGIGALTLASACLPKNSQLDTLPERSYNSAVSQELLQELSDSIDSYVPRLESLRIENIEENPSSERLEIFEKVRTWLDNYNGFSLNSLEKGMIETAAEYFLNSKQDNLNVLRTYTAVLQSINRGNKQ